MSKKILLLVLTITLVLSGCGKNGDGTDTNLSPRDGGEIVLQSYIPDTLNPLVTGYGSVSDALSLVYEGLFNVESDFSATPVLAERIASEEQNQKYIVTLKSDIKFHSGKTLTAEDVVATMDYIKKHESMYMQNLDNVENYYASGVDRIVFKLKRPQANFANMLDFPIMPSGLDAGDFSEDNDGFIPDGTGAYKFGERSGKYFTFEKNADYHGEQKGYADTVKVMYVKDNGMAVSLFDVGEVDIITTDAFGTDDYSVTVNHNTIEDVSNRHTFIGINHENSALSDTSVRIAMNCAIDKEKIASDILYLHAVASDTPVNPKANFSTAKYDKSSFDTAKAKEILKDAGWIDLDEDGILDKVIDGTSHSLNFNILVNSDNENRIKIAEFVRDSFASVGIKANVVSADYDAYISDIENMAYDLFIGETDIKNDCDLSFLIGSDGNFFGYENDNTDRLLLNIAYSTSPEEIKLNFLNLEQYFKESYPIISISFEKVSVFKNDRTKGTMRFSRSGMYKNAGNLFVNYK